MKYHKANQCGIFTIKAVKKRKHYMILFISSKHTLICNEHRSFERHYFVSYDHCLTLNTWTWHSLVFHIIIFLLSKHVIHHQGRSYGGGDVLPPPPPPQNVMLKVKQMDKESSHIFLCPLPPPKKKKQGPQCPPPNRNKSPGGLNAHLNWRKLPLVHIGVCYQLEKLWRPSPWLLFT